MPGWYTNYLQPERAFFYFGVTSMFAGLVPALFYVVWYRDFTGLNRYNNAEKDGKNRMVLQWDGLGFGVYSSFMFWFPVTLTWIVELLEPCPLTMQLFMYAAMASHISAFGGNFATFAYHFVEAGFEIDRDYYFLSVWSMYTFLVLTCEAAYYPGAAQYANNYLRSFDPPKPEKKTI